MKPGHRPTKMKTLYKLSYHYLNSKWSLVVQPLLEQYTDSRKAFERASWTKLLEILKGAGNGAKEDWSANCTRSRVLNTTGPRIVKTWKGCCLSPIPSNFNSEHLTKEGLEGFRDFKIGGQGLCTAKYAGDLGLLAKKETVIRTWLIA
jgi:hypothetical protein